MSSEKWEAAFVAVAIPCQVALAIWWLYTCVL